MMVHFLTQVQMKYIFLRNNYSLKNMGEDLYGQTEQYENSDLNQKVNQTLGLEVTKSLFETAMK